MFHMMLAAPVLAVFGAMGAAVVAVLGLLLGLGFFAVLLVRLLFHGLKWLLWLPLAIGGAVLGLLLGFGLPLTVLLGFFLLYGVVCLAGWAVSAVLRLLFGLFR